MAVYRSFPFLTPDIGGILLLDEIEQHLHPRWQRYIVQRLRKQFPKTQIIATTHTPLTASGVVDLEHSALFKLFLQSDGAYIPDFQHGDVEHFRPKGGVTDEDDNTIFLKDEHGNLVEDESGNPIPHPGYYWLAYEWRNLLPSCTVCNQPKSIGDKKIGKHNRFPVIGVHAQTPEYVENEQPLLINPVSDDEDDDPENHLTIDSNTGLMGYRTERGKMCIEIFGLNLRDQLVEERRRACREVRSLLVDLIYNPARRDEALAELIAIREGKRAHTMAARAALAELEPIFESLFDDNQ